MAGVDLPCDWKSGFIMDPSKKQRVGYLTAFKGMNMGEFLKPDVKVFTPFNNGSPTYSGVTVDTSNGTADCVGVIESYSFAGGVGDPVCIGAYISAENAEVLAAKLKTTLETTKVTSLGWWIANFDEENKVWFEEAFPISAPTVQGQLNAPGGKDVRIVVAQDPTKIAANVDVNVYHLYMEVIPAANSTFSFHFATSVKTKFVRNWGLKIGTNAAAAMG
jgi:hypothetical protein